MHAWLATAGSRRSDGVASTTLQTPGAVWVSSAASETNVATPVGANCSVASSTVTGW